MSLIVKHGLLSNNNYLVYDPFYWECRYCGSKVFWLVLIVNLQMSLSPKHENLCPKFCIKYHNLQIPLHIAFFIISKSFLGALSLPILCILLNKHVIKMLCLTIISTHAISLYILNSRVNLWTSKYFYICILLYLTSFKSLNSWRPQNNCITFIDIFEILICL